MQLSIPLHAMKLTFIFLLIGFMQLSARSSGQQVNIKLKNAPLKTLFKAIQQQTGLNIFVDAALLEGADHVTLDIKNMPVAQVMQLCLKGRNLQYTIEADAIIIEQKPAAIRPATAPPPPPADIVFTITGTITNAKGEPLPGAAVHVKGTQKGVLSDGNGSFSIVVNEKAILVVSMLGYQPKEIAITGNANIMVTLSEAVTALNDVVVVGYGIQKKSDLTGSLSQIKSKDLTAFPTTNVVQALSGRATGVQVIQNSGAPGSPISVRIRGTNSIQGSNEPLYVIDGFPVSGNPTMLNNADIESVNVLKDASATAIYGSRGANGVVLITTKKGKQGATRVDYEGSYSVQTIRKKLKLMSPIQYGEFYNEQAKNDGVPAYFTPQQLDEFKAMGAGTDWQDLVMQKAPMQNHTVNVSGGNAKTQFSASGSMLKQDGIVINSYYNRYALRANLNHDISDKFSMQYGINLTRTESSDKTGGGNSSGRGNSLYSGMISVPPSLTPYNDDGSFRVPILSYSFISNAMINPLNYVYAESYLGKENRVLGNAAVTYKPTPELVIRVSGGIENFDLRNDTYTTHKFVNSNGAAAVNSSQYTSLLNENTITYTKAFGDHHLTALGGFTYQNFLSTNAGASGSGFVSDIQGTNDLGAATVNNPSSSGYAKSVLISYLSRINYGFKDKYMLTASFRADGSSRYGTGNKWGYFPSGAVAWRVSQEEFMKDVSFISDLKLRAGFGATGSQAIAPYATMNQLVSGKTVFDDGLFTTYAPGTRLPNNLKWETTYQSDFGIDVSVLNNRIHFTADYYVKNTRDLLNSVQLPASLGYDYTIQNVGEMQNKGVELGLDVSVLPATAAFQWNLAGNISFNRNKIVKLYGGQDIYGTSYYTGVVGDFVNLLREGQPLGIFYGYLENGYDSKGNITYKDLTGDGKITTADKTYIGNPNAKYTYGLNSAMAFKGFELSLFFQGSRGNDIFNFSATQSVDLNQGMNLLEDQFLHHWTAANPDPHAKYPAVTRSLNVAVSDRYVEDGSYLRLKNIQLAYNIPMNKTGVKWLRSGQVYVSGQNLLTWTKYSWFDPEVSTHISDNSVNLGIDQFGYPTAKSVTIGVRIGL
ncbi:TonB-dependent receptor [Chitinophaga sp. MM2321]|uniref:TonB-dependent receptor n=1 Tax=Chitinophaga sp. MM2321 TaxID=3137178 RepID=UPI0032D5ABED